MICKVKVKCKDDEEITLTCSDVRVYSYEKEFENQIDLVDVVEYKMFLSSIEGRIEHIKEVTIESLK